MYVCSLFLIVLLFQELLQLLRGDKNQEERTAINNKVDEASKKVDELEIRVRIRCIIL